jgi:hypothetical protein
MRKSILDATQSAVAQVRRGVGRPPTFEVRPRRPDEDSEHHLGWLAVGRSLAWRIERSIEEKQMGRALADFRVATLFGFDLTAGDARDAALGLAIADMARAALAPAVPLLDPAESRRLLAIVREALARKPLADVAIQNEAMNVRMGVQALQDAFRNERWEALVQVFGPRSEAAIRSLRRTEGRERVAFFVGLAQEGEAVVERAIENSRQPAAKRRPWSPPKDMERPWAWFAPHLLGAIEPLSAINDLTTARTRLLGLQAWVRARKGSEQAAAVTLGREVSDLNQDPYSGGPMRYVASGPEFRLYSAGSDLKDDGGDTDGGGLYPDLTLEPAL